MPKNHARAKALAELKRTLRIKHSDAILLLDHPCREEQAVLRGYLSELAEVTTYPQAVANLRPVHTDPEAAPRAAECVPWCEWHLHPAEGDDADLGLEHYGRARGMILLHEHRRSPIFVVVNGVEISGELNPQIELVLPGEGHALMNTKQAVQAARLLEEMAEVFDGTTPAPGQCPAWCHDHDAPDPTEPGDGGSHGSIPISIPVQGPRLTGATVSVEVYATDFIDSRVLWVLLRAPHSDAALTASEARLLAKYLRAAAGDLT